MPLRSQAARQRVANHWLESRWGRQPDGAYAARPGPPFYRFRFDRRAFGGFGQTDYCLASDVLLKLIGSYRRERPWIKAIGFAWHPWDEVGMAARPETRKILESQSDLRLMSVAEGISHLLRELAARCPEPEVLVTEQRHVARFEAALNAPAANGVEGNSADEPSIVEAPVIEQPAETVELHTHRCRLRTLDAPLPNDTPPNPVFDGPAWIVGDNETARVLAERLSAAGCEAHLIASSRGVEAALADVDRLAASAPPKYLFLMTGRDDVPRI